MAYQITKLNINDAYAKVSEFDYALIYLMSEVVFGRTSDLKSFEWDECLEARFFSDDKEMHIWAEDEMNAILVEDVDHEDQREIKYVLASLFQNVGKNIVVKQYLENDEDGQSNVVLTRLCGVE